jgi:hypothetical protein
LTYALFSQTKRGAAGFFDKTQDDDHAAVVVDGASDTSEGLHVRGTITSTAYAARGVETSRGREAVFPVESAEPEIYASGSARLVGGRAEIRFDRLFTEAVSEGAEIRVTATPSGGWSALYVESRSAEGFVVRSADGDQEIAFDWMACGLSRDAGRASIAFPDPNERDTRLADSEN